MNHLQFWWILMVLSSSHLLATQEQNQPETQQQQQQQQQLLSGHQKLINFHQAVNEARHELQELRSNYNEKMNSAQPFRQRRDSIDDMLASFAQDATSDGAAAGQEDKALQKAADAWFRDFQAGLSRTQPLQSNEGLKQARAVPNKDKAKNFLNNYAKSMERTEIGKVKLKYKNVPDDTIILQADRKHPYQDEEANTATQLDIKLKQVQQLLHDHEENQARQRLFESNNINNNNNNKNNKANAKSSDQSEKLPQYGDGLIPDGVYEQTLARLNFPHLPLKANNLSHEANYKLSKFEQEASEHGVSKLPYRFPFKRSSSNFNPMNEIKLKTSNRLMRKGMGPSLPSNSLTDTRRAHLVDDLIKRRERNMQQREQRDQSAQYEDNVDSLMPQYETYSLMSASSNMDGRDGMRQMMDTPQSYDYRLPQYEQFHSLNQRPNMRDYARVKDLDRYKREPAAMEKSSEIVKLTQTDEKKLKSKDEGEEQLQLQLQVEQHQPEDANVVSETKIDDTDDQLHHHPEAVKLEKSMEEHHQNEEKCLESRIKEESKGETKVISSKILDLDTSQEQSVQSNAGAKQEVEAKNEAETGNESSSSHSDKTEVHNDKDDDATLHLNLKLKVEDPVKSAAVEPVATGEAEATAVGDLPKEESSKTGQSIKVNSDAVVKLLANEILQLNGDQGRGKRAILRKPRRRRQPQELQQHRRSKRSLDDMEDHNGNHMHVGSLNNRLLSLDPDDEGDTDLLERYDEDESESVNPQFDGNQYDNARNQVPMLNPRQQQQIYQPVPQQQVQYPQQQAQQQQQQQQLSQQQQLPQQPQQQLPQQQQQQLPQQQQQQILHQPSNFRASFNLTHFFNELSKLQKLQQPQQQQQQQQQQHQQQQQQHQQQQLLQQPSYQQQQPQSRPQQQQQYPQQQQSQQRLQQSTQMQQSIPKAIPNESKSLLQIKQSPVHRYLGPFFNKQNKGNMFNDNCITTVDPLTTINPNCVSITQPSAVPLPITKTTATLSSTIETTLNPDISTGATTDPTATTIATPSTISNTTGTTAEGGATTSATTVTPMDNICNNPDVMKLNVSINANVCGDPKTKQFYGNGSINLQPGYERLNADYDIDDTLLDQDQGQDYALVDESIGNMAMDTEDRYARQARRHKQRAQKEKGKDTKLNTNVKDSAPVKNKDNAKCGTSGKGNGNGNDGDESNSDGIEKLISGRTSEDIVNTVFDVVSNDPSMDRLAAVLERNRKCLQKKPKNFYQIRNDHNEQYLQHTEEMVRQTMEAISGIIDKQVRQRACIPLRPDLLEFYDTIVKTMADQQKCREKRENNLQSLKEDFSEDIHALDPSKIEQKSRIVKKLLRQYDELPMEDQRSVSNIRDELLMDLIYLRKMADAAERTQRNAKLNEILTKSSSKQNEMFDNGEYSPRFIKLLKTAELFKGAGEQQAKAFVGL